MFVDFNDAAATNNSHVVIRFDDINGSTIDQVPAGAFIHGASLTLASTGTTVPAMAVSSIDSRSDCCNSDLEWICGRTNSRFGHGANPSLAAGNANRTPNVEGGWNSFDVTSDIQAWTNGTSVNHGWGIVPWDLGDGWLGHFSFRSSRSSEPTSVASFLHAGRHHVNADVRTHHHRSRRHSFVHGCSRYAPQNDVTIPISSSDPSEGTPMYRNSFLHRRIGIFRKR